jgi:ApaG protein
MKPMPTKPPMTVQVQPVFLADQSSPGDGIYAFAYTITVTNVADFAIQLIARHWLIHDEAGRLQEVKGLGVIGQQPLLAPGQSFRYTSGCRLQSASGTMHGSYFVVSETGERFDVPIPLFTLDASSDNAPRVLH